MSATAVTVAKVGTFVAKNWKKVLVIVIAFLMILVMLPAAIVTAILPSASDQDIDNYKAAAKDAKIDYVELLSYDTVVKQNDFTSNDPFKSAFNFIKVDYTEYEYHESSSTSNVTTVKDGETYYSVTIEGEKTSVPQATIDGLNQNGVSFSYETTTTTTKTKVVKENGSSTGYDSIIALSHKYGYSGLSFVSNVTSFLKDKDKDDLFDFSITKVTYVGLASALSADQTEWAMNILAMLQGEDFDPNGLEYIIPSTGGAGIDVLNLANVVVDPTTYKISNNKDVFTGKSVDGLKPVFVQRVTALCETLNVKCNVVSGYRSLEQQQILWDSYPPEQRGTYVARPGYSRHNYGFAIDVSGPLRSLDNETLLQFGLWKPMSYEPWHIEPVETMKNPPLVANKAA